MQNATERNAHLEEVGGRWYQGSEVRLPDKGIAYLVMRGEQKAHQYISLGTAYELLEPGDGYTYATVMHDLVAPEAARLAVADGDLRHAEQYREAGHSFGMPRAAGGEVLVSLPRFHRCTTLNPGTTGYHTPDYLDEKLRLGMEHCVPLAIFLTAFGQRVCSLRGEA